MSKYAPEIVEFIASHIEGSSYKSMAELVNTEFGLNMTPQKIKSFCGNHKLKTGTTGRFDKGNIPHNKGKKQAEFMSAEGIERSKATRFKKGNTPVNHRPVGSERIDKDGYIEIKVAEPSKWEFKHRYIWQQANGTIPDNHVVAFLDQDKTNCDLDNLVLIDRNVLCRMNTYDLFTEDKELTETGILVAKLINETAHKRGARK